MTDDIKLHAAQCATQRAHLAGAEAGAAARRRYWREVAAVALLSGHRWPEAERLGGVA
jgi:hypothetical protein